MQEKKHWWKMIIEVAGVLMGTAILAFSINSLIVPSHLISGGVTGIAILLYHLFGWSVGIQNVVYNIPLLILGYKFLGKKFVGYTALSVASLAFFLRVIPVHYIWTDNILLSAIFGGIISGIGISIVLRLGGSTGGIDIVSRVVAKYFALNIGRITLVINSLIVLASGYFFDPQIAMYTLISIYATSRTYDVLLNHVGRITVMIVTSKGEQVAEAITKTMKRGVTFWNANGAYTHSDKQVLFCVIVNVQWSTLKKTILSEDEKAFISVIPTQKIVGNFNQVW
ncbi:YitT family protein [Tepidibacillus infernus]|uniref:DUF2179 domain-containing protein n=1 Tax=Tepidibacillus decaturensis TaxID=1413211 RepID=A0A135L2G2_9BACI|nr:YitT family protein [Tepidibacillus decaturensis]KXG43130.1 hypothetical protein U473_03145 [Tepidibacillus decaturensis]